MTTVDERAPVVTVTDEPMIPRLEAILAGWQNDTPRSQQTRLGPSEIGDPCQRKLALKLINPVKPTGLKWAALLGLWGHAGIETAFEERGDRRYLVEHRVEADEEVPSGAGDERGLRGSTDLYDTANEEVVDWKVVGEYTMKKVRAEGPSPEYRVQAHTYGLGWKRKGRNVKRVRIVFLPRWSDNIRDGYEWSEPFDETVVEKAIERLAFVDAQARAAEAGDIRWADIPAAPDPFKCSRFCPYFRSERPADRDGCPGHTRVYVAIADAAAMCESLDAVRQLWRSRAGAGLLDDEARGVLTARAHEIEERDAIAALEGAGLTVERLDS